MQSMQILLIEDDEVDQEAVQRLIGRQVNLHIETMGRDGLAYARAYQPDCVLLDYRLPDIDGPEIVSQLLELNIPVVILTIEEAPSIIISMMKQGAQDYVLKREMTATSLSSAIQNTVEKHRMQQQLSVQQRLLAEQNEEIRRLASALTLTEQRERRRTAQLLHDHVQQLLYGVQMRVHLLREDLAEVAADSFSENLTDMARLIEDAILTTRTLAVEISPPAMQDENLGTALAWLASHIERLHGLKVELAVQTDCRIDNEELHALTIQLVRELLFNIVKHANVEKAEVTLSATDEHFVIAVEDEGVGFDMGRVVQPKWQPEHGYGLYSVRKRLALFGGRLDVDSHPGNGARVTVVLPKTFDTREPLVALTVGS